MEPKMVITESVYEFLPARKSPLEVSFRYWFIVLVSEIGFRNWFQKLVSEI